jgi:hypothetical protein
MIRHHLPFRTDISLPREQKNSESSVPQFFHSDCFHFQEYTNEDIVFDWEETPSGEVIYKKSLSILNGRKKLGENGFGKPMLSDTTQNISSSTIRASTISKNAAQSIQKPMIKNKENNNNQRGRRSLRTPAAINVGTGKEELISGKATTNTISTAENINKEKKAANNTSAAANTSNNAKIGRKKKYQQQQKKVLVRSPSVMKKGVALSAPSKEAPVEDSSKGNKRTQ